MVVEGWCDDIRWTCVRRGSEGIRIRALVACSGSEVEGECVVGVMTEDLGIVNSFEAVIELDQHVSNGCRGLVGEIRKFNPCLSGLLPIMLSGESTHRCRVSRR